MFSLPGTNKERDLYLFDSVYIPLIKTIPGFMLITELKLNMAAIYSPFKTK
jgi:hypothetical protein